MADFSFNAGIDYGRGQTNIDHATGMRYGVLPAHDVGERWYEASEAQYPEDCDCGEDCYCEPIAHTYEDAEYAITQGGDDSDLFVLRSPYYTFCARSAPMAS